MGAPLLLPSYELELAVQIADDSAPADIEFGCARIYLAQNGPLQGDWWDTRREAVVDDPYIVGSVVRAVEYLRRRGLIELHPLHPQLVRFVRRPPAPVQVPAAAAETPL